jgi:AraC-like DNA-binding protein
VTWESATRQMPALLDPHVRRMQGYDERTTGPLSRPELPGGSVVMILELGPPIGVQPVGAAEAVFGGPSCSSPTAPKALRFLGGFVAGLEKRPVLTMHDGWQRGVQLDLSATGARRLLGVPMTELTGRVVAVRELLRRDERSLPEELAALPSWEARLDRVERWLHGRLAAGPRPDRRVLWAVREIEAHGGNLDVTALCRALQLSGKHLVALFREHVGVPPKLYGRLVRFERLVGCVRGGPPQSWAARAAALGYCDQAHLSRDVRALAGMTPTELAAFLGAPSQAAVWPEEHAR